MSANPHEQLPRLSNPKVSTWAARQRKDKNRLSDDQITALEAVPGWEWNVDIRQQGDSAWRGMLAELAQFVATFHRMPTQGTALGNWVSNQRRRMKRGSMPDERVNALESIPGWKWQVREGCNGRWRDQVDALEEYVNLHGHLPPRDHEQFGAWMLAQRKQLATMPERRVDALERIPGWHW